MKLAVLSPVAWRTPPRHYGPWEQIAYNIAEGAYTNGIDVTLFATKDSFCSGKSAAVCDKGYEEDKSIDAKVAECLHISHLMERADEFDLIHNNFDFLPLTYSNLIKTPIITTIHGFSSPKIVPVFKRYNDVVYYVSISNADRSPQLTYTATVYNGINQDSFTFNEQPGNYLLFFGRIHNDKGVYEAIQIAKKAKMKLLIAGIIQDQEYFREKVEPYIDKVVLDDQEVIDLVATSDIDQDKDQIFYLGEAGPEKRNLLLRNAYTLLHPINFNEPFGLSVAEAMFCGTPTIAFNRGSMPELITDGKTGFLVKTVAEAAAKLTSIPFLDRNLCRQQAEQRFSLQKMAADYYTIYRSILNR